VIAIHLTQRDDDGYYSSDVTRFTSSGYAVYASGLDLDSKESADALSGVLGRVRVQAQADASKPVFIGIGPRADVNRYLAGSARSKVEDVTGTDEVTYKQRAGEKQPAPPGDETFWSAKVTGNGVQTLNWKAEEGNFSIVVMNPDASRPVSARVSVAAKAPAVLWVGIGMCVLALVLAGIGAAMIVSDRRKRARTG
jgi:hypothetical protein